MDEYQAFPISNFRIGFDQAVEPWLIPKDAYSQVINCHLYRGVLEKIDGYSPFAYMSYRNMLKLTPTPDGIADSFTGTLPTRPTSSNFFGYSTVVVGGAAETFTYLNDASSTVVNLQGSMGGTGTFSFVTMIVTLIPNTPPPSSTYSDVFFQWDSEPDTQYAIMGIKQYYAQDGTQQVMVFNQHRMGIIEDNFGNIALTEGTNYVVSEVPHDYYRSAVFKGDGETETFSGTLSTLISPNTVHFYQFTSAGVPTPVFDPVNNPAGNVISDNGQGVLSGFQVDSTMSFVNYATGAYTITFTVAPANLNYFDSTVGIFGDFFDSSISNFFSVYNYQNKAFITNFVDPICYYDGNSIKYLNAIISYKPITSTAGVPNNIDITNCLHVFVSYDFLLLISVVAFNTNQLSTIYYSTVDEPLNFTNFGGQTAPTSQPIRAIGYINTDLVVRFANSERIFRYTGDEFNLPFRWDSTNNLWACDAPYSSINYDSWFSSVGRPAIVGSDAVNVKRVDEIIPDFTDSYRLSEEIPVPYMSSNSIKQCYGERFDDLKEGWLCYNSGPQDQESVSPSDNVLAFNYLDNTYAIYEFPFSCLGFGRVSNSPTWAQTLLNWEDDALTWDSYAAQNNALLDLAGDQFNTVYELNSANTLGDGETPVLMSVITKNFNPFIDEGQLCRFGYLDLFVSANITTTLRVQFYVNDQLYIDSNGDPAGFYQETILNFQPTDAMSPSTNQTKIWKRIYVGAVGKEHTIRLYQNAADFGTSLDQPVFIHGMVLYMKPAGRIFN